MSDIDYYEQGYQRAKTEHKTGVRCSFETSPCVEFGGNTIGDVADFRNGMTLYREENNLCDDNFDNKGE